MIDVVQSAAELTACGYVYLPRAIAPLVLTRVRERVRQYEGHVAHGADNLSYGYDLDIHDYLELVSNGASVLRSMGAHPTIKQVVLVPKKPGEGRRNWHRDSTAEEIHGTPGLQPPNDVMLLYYLEDTSFTNGCLLVLPRSDAREARGNQPMSGEIPVPVHLGDLVILDPRLHHAALANKADHLRIMIRVRFECEWPDYKGTAC